MRLSPAERAAWDAIAPKLWRLGHLTDVDVSALRLFCSAHVTVQELREELRTCRSETLRKALGEELYLWRLEVRAWAVQFLILSERQARLTPLTATGDDADLQSWFRPETPNES